MGTLTERFKTASPDRYALLLGYAKKNRRNQTVAEQRLWEFLRKEQLGVDFRRQHIIYDNIADFVCLDKMLFDIEKVLDKIRRQL